MHIFEKKQLKRKINKKQLTHSAQYLYKEFKGYRGNNLVPFSETTLTDEVVNWLDYNEKYEFVYGFPDSKELKEFIDPEERDSIEAGTCFDRLGSEDGRYVAPIETDGKVYSIPERALPYLFLEKSIEDEPSYHKYIVKRDITRKSLKTAIKSANISVFDGKKIIRDYLLDSVENGNILYGKITPVKCFGIQGIGGGMQYRLPIPVYYLCKMGFLSEV